MQHRTYDSYAKYSVRDMLGKMSRDLSAKTRHVSDICLGKKKIYLPSYHGWRLKMTCVDMLDLLGSFKTVSWLAGDIQ